MRRNQLNRSWSTQREQIGDWAAAHPIGVIAWATAVGSIVGAGILQEITNHVVDSQILPWLEVPLALPHWLEAIGVIALLVLGYMAWQQSIRIGKLQALSDERSPIAMHKKLKDSEGQRILIGGYLTTSFDVLDGLVAYLGNAAWSEGDSERIKRLLIQIILKRIQLMYATNVVPYISLYLPSTDEPGYLRIYENVNVHPDRVRRNRWYIGPDKPKRRKEAGTAGWVFINGQPKVHHINERTHKAEEGADYIPSRLPGDVALYLSFVAIPITYGNRPLGVLCLDSSHRDTFDGDPKQAELEPAAKLLASILKL